MLLKTIDVFLKVINTHLEMIIDIQKKIESENLKKKEDALNVQKEVIELLIANKILRGIILIAFIILDKEVDQENNQFQDHQNQDQDPTQ
jgi:hypothetical protein